MNNNLVKTKQLIIIGGGASINEARPLGLAEKIKDRFTCGLNYAYRYFDCTYHCYVDRDFYDKQRIELAKLKLIIGKEHGKKSLSNTINLSTATRYFRDLQGGVYSPDLCGLFALSLGIYLLDEGTIFLLGHDFGEIHKENIEDKEINRIELNKISELDNKKRYITHFYQGDFEHRGIGKISYYHSKNRARNKFSPYIEDKKNRNIKIYNVSPNSRIPSNIFEKIDYNTFFKKLDEKRYNQDELRLMMRKKLNS